VFQRNVSFPYLGLMHSFNMVITNESAWRHNTEDQNGHSRYKINVYHHLTVKQLGHLLTCSNLIHLKG
jgi:hypothetical protein